ncbi:MAG: hypothetical protein U0Y82_14150 [Thermoleophilia bacterium]
MPALNDHRDVLHHPLLVAVRPHLRVAVAAVGGVVRDALLGRAHGGDLDLVTRADAPTEAARIARAMGAELTAHPRFRTATLRLPDGAGHVDVISARSERYPHPGALPEVSPGTVADDLARRDFSINAMAVWVTGPAAERLEDPTGGLADLRAGVVRALREDAFHEDPSRVVRAARYAGRLGFDLDPDTRAAAAREAPRLRWDASRVAGELRRLLEEADPVPGLGLLAGLGAPHLEPDPAARLHAVDRATGMPGAPELPVWAVRLGMLMPEAVLAHVALPGWGLTVAAEVRRGWERRGRRPPESVAARPCFGRDAPGRDAGAFAAGAAAVEDWWLHQRDLRLHITGADLLELGVPQGPRIGATLAAVRADVLDGLVPDDRDQQLRAARRMADGA